MTTASRQLRPHLPSGFVMTHLVNPITIRLGGPTLPVGGRRTGRLIRRSRRSPSKGLATWSVVRRNRLVGASSG